MKFDMAFHLLDLESENDFIMQIIIVEEKSERVELHAEKQSKFIKITEKVTGKSL